MVKAITVVGEIAKLLHIRQRHYRVSLVEPGLAPIAEVSEEIPGRIVGRISNSAEIFESRPYIHSDVTQVTGAAGLQISPQLLMTPAKKLVGRQLFEVSIVELVGPSRRT